MPNLIAPPGLAVFRCKDKSEHLPLVSMRLVLGPKLLALQEIGAARLSKSNSKDLEIEPQSQLNLPRVENRAWRSVKRVWRPLAEGGWRRRAAGGCLIKRAEISCSIYGVKEANVCPVEQVKRLGEDFQATALLERKSVPQAKIYGAEIVADEGVAWLDANTVVIAEHVAVGVESGKLREAHRGLDRGNQSFLEVAGEGIPLLRRCHYTVEHKAMAYIVRRKSALRAEVLAVLRNQDKAGIGAVVDGLGPGVTEAIRKLM